jgi:hypothetical protein
MGTRKSYIPVSYSTQQKLSSQGNLQAQMEEVKNKAIYLKRLYYNI